MLLVVLVWRDLVFLIVLSILVRALLNVAVNLIMLKLKLVIVFVVILFFMVVMEL